MPPPRPATDTRRDLLVVGILAAIVGVPVGVVGGMRWVESASGLRDTPDEPRWLTPDALRAMTQDGTLVKARVALEAGGDTNMAALRLRLREINQLLNMSVLSHRREQIEGAAGLARLSADMLARINRFLESEGVAPLRSVAITELVMTRA